MGQYYLLVNLTNGQYVKPHDLGGGAKLLEVAFSTHGLLSALAVLISSGNGRGGGDLDSSDPIVGSWAGHRVVLAGDYDDPGLYCEDFATAVGAEYDEARDSTNLYAFAPQVGVDISRALHRCFHEAGEPFGVHAT